MLNGRRLYLSGKYNSAESKREYARLVGEWETQARPADPPSSADGIRVYEVLAKFWKWATAYYTKNGHPTGTAENYKPVLTLLRTRYSDIRCVDFGPLAVKSLQREMVEQEENRRATAVAFVVDAFNGKVASILSRVKSDNAGTLEQEIRDALALVNFNGKAFRDARITDAYLLPRLDESKWGAVAQQLRVEEREPPQQNLWVSLGSGRSPRL